MGGFIEPGEAGLLPPDPNATSIGPDGLYVVPIAAGVSPREQIDASGLPLVLIDGHPAPGIGEGDPRLGLKRLFDIVTATAALLALSPLFCLVAAAIKVSSRGPVFFRQVRQGRVGAPFRMFKFRSMRLDDCDVSGISQTVEGDPRVTPLGRFLRRTSIDELPQLLNVLAGDMSMVGPRPHVAGMMAGGVPYVELVPYYNARLAVTPGITGWAQANGLRGATGNAALAHARIEHDIAYIQNFSLLLDLRIIWMTVWREFIRGTGA